MVSGSTVVGRVGLRLLIGLVMGSIEGGVVGRLVVLDRVVSSEN